MITLIEPFDDDGDGSEDGDLGDFAEHGYGDHGCADDELSVLLRPGVSVLAPPPGTFQQVRRRAARRRLVRAVATAGAGAAMTVTAITIALWPSGSVGGSGPVAPLGPPVHSTTGGTSGGTAGGTNGTTNGTTDPTPPSPIATPSASRSQTQTSVPPRTSDTSTVPAGTRATDATPSRARTPVADPSSGRTSAPTGSPHPQSAPSTTPSSSVDAPSHAPTTRLGLDATPTAIR